MLLILSEEPPVTDAVKARFEWLQEAIASEPALATLRDDLAGKIVKVAFHEKSSIWAPSFGAHIKYADGLYQQYDKIALLTDYDVIDADEDKISDDELERRVRLQTLSCLVFELCNAANQELRDFIVNAEDSQRVSCLMRGDSEETYLKQYADTCELAENKSTQRHAEILASVLASGTESKIFSMLQDDDKLESQAIVEATRAMDDETKILAFAKNCMPLVGALSHHAYYEARGKQLLDKTRIRLEAEGKLKTRDRVSEANDKIQLLLVDADSLSEDVVEMFTKVKQIIDTAPLLADLRHDLAGRTIEVQFYSNDHKDAPKFGMSLIYGGRVAMVHDKIALLEDYSVFEDEDEVSHDSNKPAYTAQDNLLYTLDMLVMGLVMAADQNIRTRKDNMDQELVHHILSGCNDEDFATRYADDAVLSGRDAVLRHMQLKARLLAESDENSDLASLLSAADIDDMRSEIDSVKQEDTKDKQIDSAKQAKPVVGEADQTTFYQSHYDSALLLIKLARAQMEPKFDLEQYHNTVKQQAGARGGLALFDNRTVQNKKSSNESQNTNDVDNDVEHTSTRGIRNSKT